jgi:hypothetical protein
MNFSLVYRLALGGGFAILRRKSAKAGRLQESLDLKGKTS